MAGTPVQARLEDLDVERRPERIVMSLNPEYYELIWAGLKRHEFRRRFVAGQPVEWYVYLTAPVSRLAAVIELDAAMVGTPDAIAAIAEEARPGNGASVLAYVQDLPRAFAMPIRRVSEYAGLDAAAVKAELGTTVILSFAADQGCDLGVRVEDNVADAGTRDRVLAGQQGPIVVGEFFELGLRGGLAVLPVVGVRCSPRACASWRRRRWLSSASFRFRPRAACRRACRDACEARWRAGTGGEGARPVASRRRSISARRSGWV